MATESPIWGDLSNLADWLARDLGKVNLALTGKDLSALVDACTGAREALRALTQEANRAEHRAQQQRRALERRAHQGAK